MADTLEAMLAALPAYRETHPGSVIHTVLQVVAAAIDGQPSPGVAQVLTPHADDVWVFRLCEPVSAAHFKSICEEMGLVSQQLGLKQILVLPCLFAPAIEVKHTGERFSKSDDDYDPTCG